MAIGHEKSTLLEREPLFRWYLELLKSVISQNSRRLLIIGYGFRDRHINELLAEGIEKHDLSLVVVDPRLPEAFKTMLVAQAHGVTQRNKQCGLRIWEDGLVGYFQATMSKLFPVDGRMHLSESSFVKQIRGLVFQ